jgi:dolichol-phosphate mannosyltransferase
MKNAPKISIIISVFNEEENLQVLSKSLKKNLEVFGDRYVFEFLFVNDGSTDHSLEILLEIMHDDEQVKILNLGRNFGHEIAMTAGMDHATGDALIFMDADLQHPPELLPQMIREWDKGVPMILTRRTDNLDQRKRGKIANALFYGILNSLSETKVNPNMPDFRLLDKKYIGILRGMREQRRLFRGLIDWMGVQNKVVLDFEAPSRYAGKSKYSLHLLLRLALDSIISFSIKPLRIGTYLGIFTAFLSVLMGIYFVWEFLNNPDYAFSGFGTTLVMVIFLGSVQLIVLGIIGEYVGRIHLETKKRPLYFAELLENKNGKPKP